MNDETEQRCGTCRHFTPSSPAANLGSVLGWCRWDELPPWLSRRLFFGEYAERNIERREYRNCPVWQAREGESE